MFTKTIEARGHTNRDGVLNLSVNVGVADADVAVVVQVKSLAKPGAVDANGWPVGYFDQVVGSMPELFAPSPDPIRDSRNASTGDGRAGNRVDFNARKHLET